MKRKLKKGDKVRAVGGLTSSSRFLFPDDICTVQEVRVFEDGTQLRVDVESLWTGSDSGWISPRQVVKRLVRKEKK